MFTSRLPKLLTMSLIAAIAFLTVSFAVSPKGSQSYLDYAQRHPVERVIPITGKAETSDSDYYQRHLNDLTAARSLDVTDYILRHPELISISVKTVDTTDYYFRHASEK